MIIVSDFKDSRGLQHEFDHVIGVLDPMMKETSFPAHKSRHMFFFEDEEDMIYRDAPTKKDVENIIKCFHDNKMENSDILVHCYAGISRSTAIAVCLHILQGKTISEAFCEVFAVRKQMWPNSLILEHFDDIMKLDGELVKFTANWKDRNKGKMLW